MAAVPLLAVAALTPTGGLLVAVVTVPIAVVRSRIRLRDRWALVLAAVLVNAPWWVAALLSPASATGTVEGSAVFALRSEGPWGPLITALGTGGVWNSMAVPGTRGTWLAPLGTVLLLGLAALGARPVVASLGRAAAGMLALSSAGALAWCLLGAWTVTSGLAAWLTVHVPGAGLLRDAQKLLAPWALLLSLCVALGVHRGVCALVRRSREPALAPVGYLGTVAALLLLLPDLAWGVGGVLHTTTYPPGWETARVAVADETQGDVLLLPWSTYRAFPWNDGTPVLDPAPRYLTRTTVADDTLVVRTHDGVVSVPGEDPRSAAIGAALRSGTLDAARLRRWGIGAVLVETDQPGPSPIPAGVVAVPLGQTGADAHLRVYAVPGAVEDDPWAAGAWRSAIVIGVDLAAALAVALAAIACVRERLSGSDLLHSRRPLTEE